MKSQSLVCRVCHSTKTAKAFISTNLHGQHQLSCLQFSIFHCQSCLAYFLANIKVDKNYYQSFYKSSYYPQPRFISALLTWFSFYFKSKTINQYFKDQKTVDILDVGCGQGEFLRSLSSTKFRKYGLEISQNKKVINSIKDYHLLIGDIDRYKFNQQFDCITLWHVLEHLPQPQKTLDKIHQTLKPNGLLIINTPNSDSLGFKLGQQNYFHLDSPRHLFIPSTKTLSTLLQKNFQNIKFRNPYYDFPLDLFWSSHKSLLLPLIILFYPILKVFNHETIIAICQPKK